jgi:hypothetical protein
MEVKLNKAEWDGVSAEDRKKIEQIIASHFQGVSLVGDSGTAKAEALLGQKLHAFSFKNPFCPAACGVAEAAAVAACSALSGPAIPICVAAAHAAGDYCRSRC